MIKLVKAIDTRISEWYCTTKRNNNNVIRSYTLNDPRSFTLHASLTFRPAGTVIFPISSTNSGSGMVVTEKDNY